MNWKDLDKKNYIFSNIERKLKSLQKELVFLEIRKN